MKKQNFNNRLRSCFGLMAFMTLFMASSVFAEPIQALTVDGLSLFGYDSAFLVDSISFVGHIGLCTAPLMILKSLDGETFTVKSDEDIEKLSDEEKGKYVAEVFKWYGLNMQRLENEAKNAQGENLKKLQKELETMKDRQFKQLEETLKVQGEQLSLLKTNGQPLSDDEKSQICNFIEKNAEEIVKIKREGSGVIEFSTKAPSAMTTGSASLPSPAPSLQGTQVAPATNVNLRTSIVDSLVTNFNTNLASYAYSETTPKEGDFAALLEGGVKPQIDFKIETRYAAPKKIAAHMVLTEESVQDIAGLQSIAVNYLRARHDLKKQDQILFGDGTGANVLGSTVIARAFVPGAMAAKVENPNIMDVINACITDIFTTHNYTDEIPYMANLTLMNPIDFFIEFISAKDGEGKPLFPTAQMMQMVQIGGTTVVPFYKIPAGKIHVADMARFKTTNYVPYTVRIGWINDQFITNQFTMVGESRFHAFVEKLDEQAFIYDDIATIKAAILKP